MKEKKDPTILEDFFSFSFSSFPSTVTHAFPWPIKGKAGRPIRGIATHRINSDSNPEPMRTHKHTAGKRPSSRHPFAPLTRDLGHVTLSTVCNPYYKLFSASNTSSSNDLDVETFCLNQYKPRVLLAHHPSQTRNIRNLLIDGNSKQRHLCSSELMGWTWKRVKDENLRERNYFLILGKDIDIK